MASSVSSNLIVRETLRHGEPVEVIFYRGHSFVDDSNFRVLPLELKTRVMQQVIATFEGVRAALVMGRTSKYMFALLNTNLIKWPSPALNLSAAMCTMLLNGLGKLAPIVTELETFLILLKKGAVVDQRDLQHALSWAASIGRLDLVKAYVAITGIKEWELGVVQTAARMGRLNVMDHVLQNCTELQKFRNHALQWAAYDGQLAVIQHLEKSRFTADDRGSAAEMALARGHQAVAQHLQQPLAS